MVNWLSKSRNSFSRRCLLKVKMRACAIGSDWEGNDFSDEKNSGVIDAPCGGCS